MSKRLEGWTLSETLVMMIVAGVVFLAVMDGIVLFNRYARRKTIEITDNMRLYEGYYHLRHLVVSADSVSAGSGFVSLYRESAILAELSETDSLLIARIGAFTDTLMAGISGLTLLRADSRHAADSICLTVAEPDGGRLHISFPVRPAAHRLIVKELQEQEKQYAYE